MSAAVATRGAAALALLLAAGPASAEGGGPPVPPWGVWGAPGVVDSGGPAGFAGPSWGVILGHGPIGCYFTRVRADNRWLRAQVCDWNPGFGAP